jgi:hypothetical protein
MTYKKWLTPSAEWHSAVAQVGNLPSLTPNQTAR